MIVRRPRAWIRRIQGRGTACAAATSRLSRVVFSLPLVVGAGGGLGAVTDTAKAIAAAPAAARPLDDVVPAPASVEPDEASYTIGPRTRIHAAPPDAEGAAEYLADLLRPSTGY